MSKKTFLKLFFLVFIISLIITAVLYFLQPGYKKEPPLNWPPIYEPTNPEPPNPNEPEPSQHFDSRCLTKASSQGICDRACPGFEYDRKKNECAMVTIDGCSCKVPFETLEECQDICINRSKPVLPNDLYIDPAYCEQDSDCVLQERSCNNCNCPTIINKYNYKKLNCPPPSGVGCDLYCQQWDIDFQLKCENNKCTGIY